MLLATPSTTSGAFGFGSGTGRAVVSTAMMVEERVKAG
jgi:hypothetical protein